MYKRIKQINNLTIKYHEIYKYSIFAPDKTCLEDRFETLKEAEEWCKQTKDFINH